MANYSNDECAGPRKRPFKTTLTGFLEAISYVGTKGIDILLKILSNEVLKSKYRREPRALKKRHNRYPYLTVSRKESKKQNWGYSRRKGRMGLSAGEAT